MHDGMHAHMHACVCVCVCVRVCVCACVYMRGDTLSYSDTNTPPAPYLFLSFWYALWSGMVAYIISSLYSPCALDMDGWNGWMDRYQQSIYAARICLSMYWNTHLVWALLAPKLGLRIKVVRVEHLPPATLGHFLLDFPGVFHAVKSCTSTT